MIKSLLLLLVPSIALGAPSLQSEENVETKLDNVSHRDDKLIFAFIKINERPCTLQTTNLAFSSGTCITQKECKAKQGKHDGTCAKGLAVCCYFTKTGGEVARQNNTHFVNPSYPQTDLNINQNQVLTVHRVNKRICQIRLDLIDFTLAQPDVDGKCLDNMMVTGATSMPPSICGENTGQHMYFDVDPYGGPFTISITAHDTILEKIWNINIAQIECTSQYKAPPNCLQYYTGGTGVVKSFNFMEPDDTITRQIANQQYGVCVNAPLGYCRIEWSMDPTPYDGVNYGHYGFTLTEATDAMDISIIGTVNAANVGSKCKNDFVMIPIGNFKNATGQDDSSDRFCGLGFPNDVTSSVKPFALYVVTDENEIGDLHNAGFSLKYTLKGCS